LFLLPAMNTTLRKIKACNPCDPEWRRGLSLLGKTAPDNDPIRMLDILDKMGINSALWCCRTLPEYNQEWRLFAVWCARQNQDLLVYQAHQEALEVAEAYSLGQVGLDVLKASSRAVCELMPSPLNDKLWKAAGAVVFATSENAAFAARCASGWSRMARPENTEPQINHFRGILTS
jgi:hypothetical protein